MFIKKPVRFGIAPIGKFAFSHEDAVVQKNKLFQKLRSMGIDFIDLENILPDGMVRDQSHAEAVIRFLRAEGIDALMIPHCNFGTEGAAAIIARELKVPTLLWAPRDDAPLADGSRLRDSLCGVFATSRVLKYMDVNFDYIVSSRVDDPEFEQGILSFLGGVRVAKALRTARIGQIGMRIDFFWCTVIDELDLLRRFGTEVYPFDMVEFIERFKNRFRKNESAYRAELSDIKKWLNTGSLPDEGMLLSLAERDELWDMADRHHIDAFATQSFSSLQDAMGEGCALGGILAEERIPIAAETDVHGAISSVMLEAALGSGAPSFFPEFTIRHPENDNAVLMWHASAPLSLKHPSAEKVDILPPWILKSLPATSLQFPLREGPMTVCRFDGINGEYRLGTGEGRSIAGPHTREVYGWLEVDNWPQWEKRLVKGPYIHHSPAVYGHVSDVLEKACDFIPGLTCERFDRP